jgi:hypothetical protein
MSYQATGGGGGTGEFTTNHRNDTNKSGWLVEDVAGGKYKSLDEAGRRNGIRGGTTVARWIKQYGREGAKRRRPEQKRRPRAL